VKNTTYEERVRKGYRAKTNLVKDQNGDQLAESHNILNRWKN
jgi:hypothetical protein